MDFFFFFNLKNRLQEFPLWHSGLSPTVATWVISEPQWVKGTSVATAAVQAAAAVQILSLAQELPYAEVWSLKKKKKRKEESTDFYNPDPNKPLVKIYIFF